MNLNQEFSEWTVTYFPKASFAFKKNSKRIDFANWILLLGDKDLVKEIRRDLELKKAGSKQLNALNESEGSWSKILSPLETETWKREVLESFMRQMKAHTQTHEFRNSVAFYNPLSTQLFQPTADWITETSWYSREIKVEDVTFKALQLSDWKYWAFEESYRTVLFVSVNEQFSKMLAEQLLCSEKTLLFWNAFQYYGMFLVIDEEKPTSSWTLEHLEFQASIEIQDAFQCLSPELKENTSAKKMTLRPGFFVSDYLQDQWDQGLSQKRSALIWPSRWLKELSATIQDHCSMKKVVVEKIIWTISIATWDEKAFAKRNQNFGTQNLQQSVSLTFSFEFK